MSRFTLRALTWTSICAIATAAHAAPVMIVKKVNLTQDNTTSPFFTSSPSGYALGQANNTQGGAAQTIILKPQGAVQANTVTSLVSTGTYSFAGNATAANNWTDGNGIPAGITLTFNTEFTISVGAGSPTGSTLTTTGLNDQTSNNIGNGLGITQTTYDPGTGIGGTSTLESNNLNEIPNTPPDPNDKTESLDFSAVTVSNVSFTGSVKGFNFTPGTIGNFGPYAMRSSGFQENGETAALISANNATDPQGLGRPTIGFGTPSADPSEIGRGQGFVASNVFIENGFTAASAIFPRQPGPFTFVMQNGTMGFKGIGFEYDVNYDIVPAPGDYNHNGTVDAADYVLWRKGDLAADGNNDSVVDQLDYDFWRANFGNSYPGPGSGSGGAVPEPATLALLFVGVVGFAPRRRFASRR